MTGLVIGRYVISRQKTLVCGRQIRNDYLQKTDTYRPITRPDKSIIPSTDYRTGCRNVSHYQQQQSCSGLRSPGRSNSTYCWNDCWVQTFHSKNLIDSWLLYWLLRITIWQDLLFWNLVQNVFWTAGKPRGLEHARIQGNVSSLDPFTEQ